jgi:3-oxoacyl-[acyl-carrier-protein] synthase I
MAATTHVVLLASGMVTAIGFNAPATLAALRAGVSGISRLPWLDPESGEALSGAKVALPHWWEGVGKLADLVAPAIHECLQSIAPAEWQNIPILIGVAAPERPGRLPDIEQTLLAAVFERLGLRTHSPNYAASGTFAGDQFSGAQGLQHAHHLIHSGAARFVVVAGVDSYLRQATLKAYATRRRLMTPSNSNGFFPGEAGAAVLVGAQRDARPGDLRVAGFGTAQEPVPIETVGGFQAQGLTQAVKQALASGGLEMRQVDLRLTDLSGEHYKFKEAAFVITRLDRGERAEPLDLWHPVEYLGEIGAAILPCLLAWAAHAHREGYAAGPTTLCHVGSDAGARAAIVLQPVMF